MNPSNFTVSVNGSKGSGEKGWVNKQSSLIAKNGGKIDTDSLTNIGGELLFDDNKKFIGIRVSGGLTKDIDEVKLELPPNVYGSVDNSIITSSKFIKKSKKEIEKQIGYDLDRISELAKDKIRSRQLQHLCWQQGVRDHEEARPRHQWPHRHRLQ